MSTDNDPTQRMSTTDWLDIYKAYFTLIDDKGWSGLYLIPHWVPISEAHFLARVKMSKIKIRKATGLWPNNLDNVNVEIVPKTPYSLMKVHIEYFKSNISFTGITEDRYRSLLDLSQELLTVIIDMEGKIAQVKDPVNERLKYHADALRNEKPKPKPKPKAKRKRVSKPKVK